MTSKTRLHLEDLTRTLDDERHLGFGYATADDLTSDQRDRLDRSIISVANELALDYDDLFHWANSKNARWLCDEASGAKAINQTLVRRYLNDATVASAKEF